MTRWYQAFYSHLRFIALKTEKIEIIYNLLQFGILLFVRVHKSSFHIISFSLNLQTKYILSFQTKPRFKEYYYLRAVNQIEVVHAK